MKKSPIKLQLRRIIFICLSCLHTFCNRKVVKKLPINNSGTKYLKQSNLSYWALIISIITSEARSSEYWPGDHDISTAWLLIRLNSGRVGSWAFWTLVGKTMNILNSGQGRGYKSSELWWGWGMGSLILLLSATVGLQDLERGLEPGGLLQAFSHVRLKMRQ